MASVAETARIWQQAGVSVIPIKPNGTKRPAVLWAEYQVTAPTLGVVDQWWGNGHEYGLALICGGVSGNLEMTEVEGRAMDSESLTEIMNRMDELGARYIWDLLSGPDGFTETSPSGGIHFLYRVSDHEVPGNTKIAQKAQDAEGNRLCLVETRGHGGYVIVAPTSGTCHPSGDSWQLLQGQYGILPTITWHERNLFHQALRLALDETPSPPAVVTTPSVSTGELMVKSSTPSVKSVDTQSPGDAFEEKTEWSDPLLLGDWYQHPRIGQEQHWTRPGKDPRDGISATTGRANDRDRLWVFSTSTVFPSETPITKFGAYTILHHGGDHKAAASALAKLNFGSRPALTSSSLETIERITPVDQEEDYTWDDIGNGQRFAQFIRGRFRWATQEKCWFRWTESDWLPDTKNAVEKEWELMTRAMADKAQRDGDDELAGWTKKCRSKKKMNDAIPFAKAQDLMFSATEFDQNRNLLNLENGTLELDSGTFREHRREDLITHKFGTAYDPEATCPKFEDFIEKALPDEELRSYVQRALGYSLLGDADQRALFVLHGPSGTGKSTILETIGEVFGTYATTAQAGTFRAAKSDKGPSNDLHELRGRRFVTTSETAENASFDEDLLKRITGRDKVRSRALYQESQEWTPQCTLWMATNNPPRLNSDDDAIWRRLKLIPMTTVFRGEGEVFDYARRVLVPEAAGILNWLLAGLRDFQAQGLGEPEALQIQAEEQRTASDSVARFIGDKLSDASLVEGSGTIKATELYAKYAEWCRQTGERSLGSRRFMNRMDSHMGQYEKTRDTNGVMYFSGLHRPAGSWMVQLNAGS